MLAGHVWQRSVRSGSALLHRTSSVAGALLCLNTHYPAPPPPPPPLLALPQVPQEAYAEFAKGAQRGAEARKQWEEVGQAPLRAPPVAC